MSDHRLCVLNAGSSSLKFAVYDVADGRLSRSQSGEVERIGGEGRLLGPIVGALIVDEDSELYAITSGGGVIRTAARQVRKAGRQTKGVRLMNLGEENTLLAIARNAEENADEVLEDDEGGEGSDG